MSLPPTDLRLEHRDGIVYVSDVSLGGGVDATLTGELPVALNLLEGFEPRVDDPFRLELALHSTQIAPFIEYTTHLSRLDGAAGGGEIVAAEDRRATGIKYPALQISQNQHAAAGDF